MPESPIPESALSGSPIPESPIPESPIPESALPESALPESALPGSPVPESAMPWEEVAGSDPGRDSDLAFRLGARRVRELLSRYDIHPSKALGQNFVIDPNTVERIVSLSGVREGDRVVEVGPGLGALTLALVRAKVSIRAIEMDPRLASALCEVLDAAGISWKMMPGGWGGTARRPGGTARGWGGNARKLPAAEISPPGRKAPQVEIVVADALRMDWPVVTGAVSPGTPACRSGGPAGDPDTCRSGDWRATWRLVANLPYAVATPLIMQVLEKAPAIDELFVMVQEEVAERLTAVPRAPGYGAVSVKVAYWARAEVVARIRSTVFFPQPAVGSALVRIVRREALAIDEGAVSYQELASVLRMAFSSRRKMLRGSLGKALGPGVFSSSGISPEARAEELGIEAWGRLAAAARVPTGTSPASTELVARDTLRSESRRGGS